MSTGASPTPSLPLDSDVYAARNTMYRNQVWYLLASFIGLVAVCQLLSWIGVRASSSHTTHSPDAEGRTSVKHGRRRQWSRLPLACINYFRVVAFRFTIDIGDSISVTYAEALMVLAYIVAMLTWNFVNTTNVAGSSLDVQYWSTRAGSLAVTQFPLVTVLGTKNNLLSYITGVSYDKLNFLHRMTARVVLILLWIHGASKASATFYLLPASFYGLWLVRLGITMLTGFTILAIIAIRPLRSRFYEAFFFTHFSVVLLILIGGYFHAEQAAQLGVYICPCFYIWGADRLLRLLRVVWFNSYLLSGASAPKDGSAASAELLSPQFVRLRVRRPPHLKWTPGQAVFLTAPGVARFPLEAHPFTIASVDSRYRLSTGGKRKRAALVDREDASPVDEKTAAGVDWEELEFYINVREGFTRRLADVARRGEEVKVWVDGPYGFSPNLRNDDTVVLVAGGSGVSLAIAMFLGVVSDVQSGESRCRKLVFIWSIRDPKQLEWISSALTNALELCPPSLEVSIRIFLTGHATQPDQKPLLGTDADTGTSPSSPNPNSNLPPRALTHPHASVGASVKTSLSKSKDNDTTVDVLPASPAETRGPSASSSPTPRELGEFSTTAVRVTPGRPNLHHMLRAEVDGATGGRLSVTVCGSAAIAKSCRKALRLPFGAVLEGAPSVVLHVESFGYA